MNQPLEKPVLHGGAERMPLTWLNADPPPMRLSQYRVRPGQSVSLHVHTGKIEIWVVLQGSGQMRLGEQSLTIRQGDVIETKPGTPHGLLNTGSDELWFLNIVQPTGDAEITSTELE